MNLFTQFLRRTAKRLLLTPQRLSAIERLDPSHIYVENIRSIFGLTTALARGLCELAVSQGILTKMVEVRCPDETTAAEAPSAAVLPSHVICWKEVDGNFVEAEYDTAALNKYDFYVYKQERAV
jgi:hypothetical protein